MRLVFWYTVKRLCNSLVNKTNLVLNFFLCIYFYSLHVSVNYVPFIRRNNCMNATPGICHSVWMTVLYAYSYTASY
jgi:hypothetical protein